VTLNLAHAHATGVQGQNLLVKTSPAGLVLGNDLRLETGMAIAGNFDWQFAKFALECLLAFAVSGVATGMGHALVFSVTQVLGHFRFKGAFDQSFGELLEQAVLADEVFRFFVVSQQAVDEFVAYGHF
jgi:hypothetical protein